MVGFEYGYDRRSNRLFEKDTYLGTVGSKPLKVDALLQYDGLDRVVDFQRGQLNLPNDGISNANLTQDWMLDQTGNWNAFNQTQQVPSVRTLNQTRTHDPVNEITDIDQDPGQTIWANPTHDANGNMTVIPKPSDLTAAYTATWDAWNRLVELTDNGEVVAAYQYDGTNRRIVVADNATVAGIDAGFLETDIEFFPEQWNGTTGGPFPPGEFDATGSYFTTESETVNIGNINYGIAVDDDATGSGFMMYSVEDLHSRFGTSSSSNTTGVNANNADHLVAVRLNGTQWQYNSNYTWNNFNPVAGDRLLAEVDFTANTARNLGWRRVYYSLSAQALEERLGSQVHQQYVWGLRFVDDLILRDRDSNDSGTIDERLYAMHDLRFSIVAVANASGVVQERYTYDAYGIRTVMDALFVDQASTTVDWQFACTGRRLDSATGLYFFRARYYSAQLGRFIGRDPLGFVDGMNLYRAYFTPFGVDPWGMSLEHWHHLLPQEFDEVFLEAGFNIHEARWGRILPANVHAGLHGQGWNMDWDDFIFDNDFKLTKTQIYEQLRRMDDDYFQFLRHGRDATCPYRGRRKFTFPTARGGVLTVALAGALGLATTGTVDGAMESIGESLDVCCPSTLGDDEYYPRKSCAVAKYCVTEKYSFFNEIILDNGPLFSIPPNILRSRSTREVRTSGSTVVSRSIEGVGQATMDLFQSCDELIASLPNTRQTISTTRPAGPNSAGATQDLIKTVKSCRWYVVGEG